MDAAGSSNVVRVASLLNSGADIHVETMDVSPTFQCTDNCPIKSYLSSYWQYTTPLMIAASFGCITTLQLLLDRGAKVDRKDEVRIEHVPFFKWDDQQHR